MTDNARVRNLVTQSISVSEEVMVQTINNSEAVLLNLQSEKYFGLDEVGSRIFSIIAQSGSVQLAYVTIMQEYDVSSEQLYCDLTQFVEILKKEGLIDVTDA